MITSSTSTTSVLGSASARAGHSNARAVFWFLSLLLGVCACCLVFFLKTRPSAPSEPSRGRKAVGDPVFGMFVTGAEGGLVARVGNGVIQVF